MPLRQRARPWRSRRAGVDEDEAGVVEVVVDVDEAVEVAEVTVAGWVVGVVGVEEEGEVAVEVVMKVVVDEDVVGAQAGMAKEV